MKGCYLTYLQQLASKLMNAMEMGFFPESIVRTENILKVCHKKRLSSDSMKN